MLLTIIIFVLVLGILVLVHELGHFVAAKKFGMGVEEFGFWFPPRLFKIKRKGTTYSFNLIPLGGFVKIKGEDGENRTEPNSFAGKPIWQRAVTLVAGVSMNILLAVFLISFGYKVGLPTVVEGSATDGSLKDPKVQIVEIAEGSPAAQEGLQVGDTILKINDQSIADVNDVQKEIGLFKGQNIPLLIERGKEIISLNVTPRSDHPADQGPLGVALVKTAIISYPLGEAIWKGLSDTFYFAKVIVMAFVDLVSNLITSGKVSANLSGPVGVAVLTGKVARMGWIYLLQFTALLSVNLAIINILPFPALDGGRLLFLGIEGIIRHPLNRNFEKWANTLGFALLMILIVVVSFRDVFRFGILEKIKDLF